MLADHRMGRTALMRARLPCAALLTLAILGLASAVLVATPASLRAEDYFKGKQIRMIVGTPPGGGYDAYARLVATHLGRHLPGAPSFIVQNMPGAGSITLANYLANIAPRDGTAMAAVHSLAATHPMFYTDRAKYDARKFAWVGSALRETYVGLVRGDVAVKGLDDVLKTEILIAGSTGATNSYPFFTNALLGTKFKVIGGYPGTKDGMLAVERKEVDGLIGTTYASLKATNGDWLRDGRARLIVQFGLQKHRELPDTPWIHDYAKTDEQRAAMDLMFGTQEFGRPYVLPPGVSAGVVAMMRDAFAATMRDPEFLADAQKRRLDIEPTAGAEIGPLIDRLYAMPEKVVQRVKDVVGNELP